MFEMIFGQHLFAFYQCLEATLYVYIVQIIVQLDHTKNSILFYRFNPPRRQPDNREKIQSGGEDEACLAVLNNFYGDGIKWHDVACILQCMATRSATRSIARRAF